MLRRYRDDDARELPPTKTEMYTVNSFGVAGVLACLTESPCSPGEFEVTLRNLVATLTDNAPPTVSDAVPAGGPVRGIANVPYSASDLGSGIASAALIVDGLEQPSVHDGNEGRCPQQPPYRFLVPCRLKVKSSLPLDTRSLREGEHEVKLVVVDAAGQRTESGPVTFTVHNAPTSTSRPLVAGLAKVGGQLTTTTGRWDGAPTTFAYQWLQCPAAATAEDTAGCAPIPGATSPQYAPGAADAHQRVLVNVTATNASGSGSAISAPSEIIAAASARPHKTGPVLSHVSLSRKRFRATGRGTLLSFSSSKAGHLLIVIARKRSQRKPKPIAKLAAAIKAGRSTVPRSAGSGWLLASTK